jgi:hypothetical protein
MEQQEVPVHPETLERLVLEEVVEQAEIQVLRIMLVLHIEQDRQAVQEVLEGVQVQLDVLGQLEQHLLFFV